MKLAETSPVYDENYPHLHEIIDRSQGRIARLKDAFLAYSEVARPLGIGSGDTLLDVGAGIGRTGHYLRHLGVETINLECNKSAPKSSNELWGDQIRNRYVLADGSMALPLASKSVDAVCSQDFLEHITPDLLQQSFQEMVRVLKGDRMVHAITVMEEPDNMFGDETHQTFWSAEEWKTWFDLQGWETVSDTTRYVYAPRNKRLARSPYRHGYFLLQRND